MILIRCDANTKLGFGHLVRCRALANALVELGVPCVLVGPSKDYQIEQDKHVFTDWFPMPFGQTVAGDASELLKHLKDQSSNLAVLDDYRIDFEYQRALKKANIRWLQFNGNMNQKFLADLILNPSPQASKEDYLPLLENKETKLLLGPNYSILRSEFLNQKKSNNDGLIKKILLTFGGGDDRGAILLLLQKLLPNLNEEIKFLVISGEHNPRNNELKTWIEKNGNSRVDLEINPMAMAPSIASCDLAIMAGGGTVYEVNSLNIPMFLISIAENQIRHSQAWEKTGAAIYSGALESLDLNKMLQEVKKLIHESSKGKGRTSKQLVDGRGQKRVAQKIMDEFGI